MFQTWLAYAEEFPERKNAVCLETHGKLNNWVKEQRRKFIRNVMSNEQFKLLQSNGFVFAPRKLKAGKSYCKPVFLTTIN